MRGRGRAIALLIVASVLVLALAVVGVLQTLSVRHHDQLDDRRKAAIAAASEEVSRLLTVTQSSSTSVLHALLDGATADFHDQLEKEATAFRQAIVKGKVASTGSVAAAALDTLHGDTAVVVVAARASVKNASTPKGDQRNYRLTVTVEDHGGRWLVSKLDFVV